MRRIIRSLGISSLVAASLLFAGCGSDRAANPPSGNETQNPSEPNDDRPVKPSNPSKDDKILEKYQHLDPNHFVPTDLLKETILYFDKNKSKFKNQNYITVIDFRPRSDQFRFFVINTIDGTVDRYHTAHGNGSIENGDQAFAVKFGNEPGSNKSSLGFARTNEVYTGSLGRSLRLDGLSSTNSNIRRRAIVIHGSDLMREADIIQPVSGGCPMLDLSVRDSVIDRIKGKSLVYSGYSAP